MSDQGRLLTKSEFRRGSSCVKRLWLDRWRPELRSAPSAALQERFENGRRIGELAWLRYPTGRLVTKGESVSDLIQAGADCLFEPTFVSEGRKARLDVIFRTEEGWVVDEVKMATAKPTAILEKSDYLYDLAFQVLTAQRTGLEVCGARLLMVDGRYSWSPPAPTDPKHKRRKPAPGQLSLFDGFDPPSPASSLYDPFALLTDIDLTVQVGQVLPRVEERARHLAISVEGSSEPDVEKNTHCKKCEYFDYCHAGGPRHDVIHLPGIKPKDVRSLRLAGFDAIEQISDEYGLGEKWLRVRDVIRSGSPYVGPGLADRLRSIPYPAAFIDCETSGSPFPCYPGTRPYQAICFQWSAHILSAEGSLRHREFLACDKADPRPEFCRAMLEAVRDCPSILHYSSYEVIQIRAMADEGIPDASELLELIQERSVDLEKIVEQHVYLEDFMGRTSIKVVLPALVPSLSYEDLAIQDGESASAAFREMVGSDDPVRHAHLREALLRYCERDTLAMVEVLRALTNLAGLVRFGVNEQC